MWADVRSQAMRTVAQAAVLAAALLFTVGRGNAGTGPAIRKNSDNSPVALSRWPQVILWAWQRPSDLSFIDPSRVGVSYLVETIRVGPAGLAVVRNANAVKIPSGVWLMACARIEMDPGYVPPPARRVAGKLALLLSSLARFPGARAIQIDFDATESQRGFYRNLLAALRRRLPPSVPVSMTALASWCEGDDWLSGLPVREAVPMLFRMGVDRDSVLFLLEAGDDFHEPLCRKSAGISTDELLPRLRAGRSIYIFNPGGWTRASFKAIMSKLGR